MKRKPVILIIFISIIAVSGCIKETYDMKRLSKRATLSPALGISAVKGNISLSDLVKPNDTVVFDNDGFVRIIFREDSVIDLKMADFYDLNSMVAFNQTYTAGEMNLNPFSGNVTFPVNEIGQKLTPPVTFTNGTYPNFPSFPSTSIGEKTYSPFPNFEYATFSQGSIDIFVHNNLPVLLYGVTIRLFNSAGHTQIGNDIIITAINPGQTGAGFLNLAGLTFTNSVTADVILHGSPGSSSPVTINLSTTNISVGVEGRDIKVKSGRVILPVQQLSELDGSDIIDFDPGNGIEIDSIKILNGNLSYQIINGSPLRASVSVELPTSLRGTNPITETIVVNPNSTSPGNISLVNTSIGLGSVAAQRYNKVPLNYAIEVSSGSQLVNFNSTDEISIDLSLDDPEFDFVKGYFGQEVETIDADSLDLDIGDILSHITGSFLVSNPVIRLNYKNSFAIPVEIDLNAKGYRGTQSVDLSLNPFTLSYPAAPAERDKTGSFVINRSNSNLPGLISLPPEKIKFSGSLTMNPLGNTTPPRGNYIFGNSRFLGSLEFEVPMEFRINNLHFADTVDNFLKDDDPDNESSFGPDDIQYLKVLIKAKNRFPLGVAVEMWLYDSVTKTKKATVSAANLLKPALVDNNGRVTEAVESTTEIEITSAFWNSVNSADQIIFSFTLNTTDNTTKDVRIYSDYNIDFSASLIIKPEFSFK